MGGGGSHFKNWKFEKINIRQVLIDLLIKKLIQK